RSMAGTRKILWAGSMLAALALRGVAQESAFSFREVAREMGLTFNHQNASTKMKLLPETMGSGCALFDYDGDGFLDIYLMNGRSLTHEASPSLANALYHNEGGRGFRDVTEASGTAGKGYGMGCAVADIDND